jgi:hypothetical protein
MGLQALHDSLGAAAVDDPAALADERRPHSGIGEDGDKRGVKCGITQRGALAHADYFVGRLSFDGIFAQYFS